MLYVVYTSESLWLLFECEAAYVILPDSDACYIKIDTIEEVTSVCYKEVSFIQGVYINLL